MKKFLDYNKIPSNHRLNNGLTYQTISEGLDDIDFVEKVWNWFDEGVYFGKMNLFKYALAKGEHNNFSVLIKEANDYLTRDTIVRKKYNDNYHSFAKRVWLLDEYIKGGRKFNTPISVHYNPRVGYNMIHPGTSRIKILHLMEDENYETDVWYFNTTGVHFEFMKSMKKLDREDIENLVNNQKGFMISYSADFGTLTPHITIDGDITSPMGSEYHNKCRDIIKDRYIYTNTNIKELNKFKKTSREKSDISLIVKNKLTDRVRTKLILFAFLNHDYEDNEVLVSITPKVL
jgi:hypothetical protein